MWLVSSRVLLGTCWYFVGQVVCGAGPGKLGHTGCTHPAIPYLWGKSVGRVLLDNGHASFFLVTTSCSLWLVGVGSKAPRIESTLAVSYLLGVISWEFFPAVPL